QRQPEVRELPVIVPDHGRHRRDALECGEHSFGTDVTGVEDKGDALKRGRHTRVQIAMRVRDQPDHHRLRLYMRKCGSSPLTFGEQESCAVLLSEINSACQAPTTARIPPHHTSATIIYNRIRPICELEDVRG